MKITKTILHYNHVALGLVLALGVAGQAFAGTSLSCAGFPKDVNGYVQVCKMVALTPPATPDLSVTTSVGDVTAHGGQLADPSLFPVYARIVAQDATEDQATQLANSVNISTDNGTVSAQKIDVTFPRSLKIDYEVFTFSNTNVSLAAKVGNASADSYNSTLDVTTSVGNVSLQTVDGDVNVKVSVGNIVIGLTGAAWTGTGLTATSNVGNILLSRPQGYQALITANTRVGEVEIDGQVKSFIPPPATLTAGSGQPMNLKAGVGDVTARTN